MKICFTLDDGLVSQKGFVEDGLKGTFFILPCEKEKEGCLKWQEVKKIKESGSEIGFHGLPYKEGQSIVEVEKEIKRGLDLFWEKVQERPISFAYTNMRPYMIEVFQKHFLWIRDYFWRDRKESGYVFRVQEEECPEKIRKWREKIFCTHPVKGVEGMFRILKRIESNGYEYCVLILHNYSDEIRIICNEIRKGYEICLFKEIFMG